MCAQGDLPVCSAHICTLGGVQYTAYCAIIIIIDVCYSQTIPAAVTVERHTILQWDPSLLVKVLQAKNI